MLEKTFFYLAVIAKLRPVKGFERVLCECICGETISCRVVDLESGIIKSCGCHFQDVIWNPTDNTQGRLKLLKVYQVENKKRAFCICKCGNFKDVVYSGFKFGSYNSCGCLVREKTRERTRKHGGAGSRLYGIWLSMLARCEKPSADHYDRYGGRGILVEDYLKDYNNFKSYCEEIGYKEGLTIDRIDNNGNYVRGNLRFTTYFENNLNRECVKLTKNNVLEIRKLIKQELPFQSIADRFGVSLTTVYDIKVKRTWSKLES